MGFMAGFSEVVVDQYNKNQDRQDEESKMALQARLEYLQKQRESYDSRVEKDKEIQAQAEEVARLTNDPDFTTEAARLLRTNKNLTPLEIVDMYPQFKKKTSKDTTTTVVIPNDDLPAQARPKSLLAEKFGPADVPEAVAGADLKTTGPVTNDGAKYPAIADKPTDLKTTGPVTNDGKKYPAEYKSTEAESQNKDNTLIDEADKKLRKVAPHLYDYEKDNAITEAMRDSNMYEYVPATKEWKAPSMTQLVFERDAAEAKGDKAGVETATHKMKLLSEAQALETMSKRTEKDPTVRELFSTKQKLEAQLKKDPENPDLIAQMESIDAELTAAEKAANLANRGKEASQIQPLAILRKDSKTGRWVYQGQVAAKSDSDGMYRNINSSNRDNGGDLVTGDYAFISEEQQKRISSATANFGKASVDYNNRLASYSGIITTGAMMMNLLDSDEEAASWTSEKLADLKTVQQELSSIASAFGDQTEAKEVSELVGGLENAKTAYEQNKTKENLAAIETSANRVREKIEGMLSQKITDKATNSILFRALRTSAVYSLAAANGETGRTLSNLDTQNYTEQLSGRTSKELAMKLQNALAPIHANLVSQQKQLNSGMSEIGALEKEITYNNEPIDLGIKAPRVDEFLEQNKAMYSNDPKVLRYITELAKGGRSRDEGSVSTQTQTEDGMVQINGKTYDPKKTYTFKGKKYRATPNGFVPQ